LIYQIDIKGLDYKNKMWNKQLIYTIYNATVIPVTCCTVTLSVYSRGYSDTIGYVYDKQRLTFFQYANQIAQSAMVGYFIGIIYPVGIPACIGYLYMTEA